MKVIKIRILIVCRAMRTMNVNPLMKHALVEKHTLENTTTTIVPIILTAITQRFLIEIWKQLPTIVLNLVELVPLVTQVFRLSYVDLNLEDWQCGSSDLSPLYDNGYYCNETKCAKDVIPR